MLFREEREPAGPKRLFARHKTDFAVLNHSRTPVIHGMTFPFMPIGEPPVHGNSRRPGEILLDGTNRLRIAAPGKVTEDHPRTSVKKSTSAKN